MSTDAPGRPAPRGAGRQAQTDVFTAGISGARPRIPTRPRALEQAARKALSAEAFAYIAGGAGAEQTVAANRAAFARWEIWPRPLRDVSTRDLTTAFLGVTRATPLLLAPLGVMELAHPDADLAVAKAAAKAGVPYVLSGQASFPMERVAAAGGAAPRLFQLYWSSSDELNASLMRRAEASGCEAVVITLDTHLLGWRTRDLDLGYLPFTRGMGIAQYTTDPVFRRLVGDRVRTSAGERPAVRLTPRAIAAGLAIARNGAPLTGAAGVRENLRSPLPRAAVQTFLDIFSTPALTWNDLAKAREWTKLPLILKGIVHPDDAAHALDVGVDGIWISNHGGRQIDRSVPTLAVLPEIARLVDGRVPIVFDSGIRSGADACIALALGANLVALGRPYAYALAVAGEAGVTELIRNIVAELDITLGLSGATSIAELNSGSLRAV